MLIVASRICLVSPKIRKLTFVGDGFAETLTKLMDFCDVYVYLCINVDALFIPQTVFSCRGSGGFGSGPVVVSGHRLAE